MSDQALGTTTLAQVAIVVKDIETTAKHYAALLALPVPEIIVLAPGLEVNQTYLGKPSNASAKLAFFQLGPVQLELIEPIGDESSWKDVLDRKGEGFHHLAFWVTDMQKRVDFLREQGIRMVHRGDMGEGQFAYFDAEQNLGITLELLEHKREKRAEP
jgi:catechol 2,3-dioxygenase-like lactoylglutathione lyase family enzyme